MEIEFQFYSHFPFPRGNLVEIKIRSKMKPSEFSVLRQLIDLLEDCVVDAPAETAAPDVPARDDS